MKKLVDDSALVEAYDHLVRTNNAKPRSEDIKNYFKAKGISIDEATIRGRFITMGKPLSGKKEKSVTMNPDGTTAKTKFVTGQKIFIRPDIESVPDQEPFLNAQMRTIGGQQVTVDYVDNKGFIHIQESEGAWREEWLIEKITPKVKFKTVEAKTHAIPDELKPYIPTKDALSWYVKRDVDDRLALHYDLNKHPISQGKQGCGKTVSHMHYAFSRQLPFFLFSCYEDFKLAKLFGDKTIINGSIRFQESLFVKAIQHPSVILFDEINAVSQANTYDFHALLQNRQLFIKDANDGTGKLYILHPECKIGFAQNPKSAKYIGGNIRSSNFLGRCTYLTYPEFSTSELKKAVLNKYPDLPKDDAELFIKFYGAVLKAIDQASIPVDVSIRQLNNVIDLYLHGAKLEHAIEDGIASIVDSISQPTAKQGFKHLAEATWKDLMKA